MENITEPSNGETNIIEYKYSAHEFFEYRKNNYLPQKLIFASASFNRVEQRLWEFFLNQINYQKINPLHGIEVKIPIAHIKKYIPESRQVMKVTGSMAEKKITVSDLSKSEIEFKHVPIFTLIDFNSNKSGVLVYRTNPLLSPFLAELGKNYAKYDFNSVMSLKSTYAALMYMLLHLHIGQNRNSFVYSIVELKKILEVGKGNYDDLTNFKLRVLDTAQRECANAIIPVIFTYENEGNKNRNVTHIRFNIITAFTKSKEEKREFSEAIEINPKGVFNKLEEIIDRKYKFTQKHKKMILESDELMSKLATLHIEFENGLHSKVKNRTAYILACMGLVKNKS